MLQMENCLGILLRRHNYLLMSQGPTTVLSVFQVLVCPYQTCSCCESPPVCFYRPNRCSLFPRGRDWLCDVLESVF